LPARSASGIARSGTETCTSLKCRTRITAGPYSNRGGARG
jgi:hypothetical protein